MIPRQFPSASDPPYARLLLLMQLLMLVFEYNFDDILLFGLKKFFHTLPTPSLNSIEMAKINKVSLN